MMMIIFKRVKILHITFDPLVKTVYLEDKIMQLKGKTDYKDVKWYNSKFKVSIHMCWK